jgi:hypothetical protein
MKKYNIIQYLPLTHPKATFRFMRRLNSSGVMCILDLEDSAQDPFDKTITANLKNNARSNFLNLASNSDASAYQSSIPTFVRVNDMKTTFFEDDMNAIVDIVNTGFPIDGIFIPKVNNYDEIICADEILAKTKNDVEIVPMIETKEGMQNLENILAADADNDRFSKIHYGHFDYCLDSNLWPFPDPNHLDFWNLILPMAKLIHSFKKTYIHTPFPFPNNSELFWSSADYLQTLFPDENPWICTLNAELSNSQPPKEKSPINFIELDQSKESATKEANIIQADFLSGRANKRSFGVSSGRFIPPHQYFAALNFLELNKG